MVITQRLVVQNQVRESVKLGRTLALGIFCFVSFLIELNFVLLYSTSSVCLPSVFDSPDQVHLPLIILLCLVFVCFPLFVLLTCALLVNHSPVYLSL